MTDRFLQYITKVGSDSFLPAVKVTWLNPDETVQFEVTNDIYDISGAINVNLQDGLRRTCTIVLDNSLNKFPINCHSIWFGQKFKVWAGVRLDDGTPFYMPQGVFYVVNPTDTYNPDTQTITLQGEDKWCYLNGELNGNLTASYRTPVGANLIDAIYGILKKNKYDNMHNVVIDDANDKNARCRMIDPAIPNVDQKVLTRTTSVSKMALKCTTKGELRVTHFYPSSTFDVYDSTGTKIKTLDRTQSGIYQIDAAGNGVVFDSVFETEKEYSLKGEQPVVYCPYTSVQEAGKTWADIILEYAKMLMASVYYDADGRLTVTPLSLSIDNTADTDKSILWNFTVEEQELLGLELTSNFTELYNDITVLGAVVDGKQAKARVQNRSPYSETSIEHIGIKSKPIIEDEAYMTSEQCRELALYYAKTDTILSKSGTLTSTPLFHLDVDKMVTVSTHRNRMSKEKYLVTGFSLPLSGTEPISLSVVQMKELENFEATDA